MTTSLAICADIVKREGGYVDDPDDHGGPTNMGVTIPILSAYRGMTCTADDIQHLTSAEAIAVTMNIFVEKPGFSLINDGFLQACVVDSAVQHGPTHPIQWLQEIVGVEQDGVFGPNTARAVNGANAHAISSKFLAARARFFGQIITGDETQYKFDAGWMDRLAGFIEQL